MLFVAVLRDKDVERSDIQESEEQHGPSRSAQTVSVNVFVKLSPRADGVRVSVVPEVSCSSQLSVF